MSKLIENTLAAERPDFGFEQRVISRFRRRIPARPWMFHVGQFFRSTAVRVAAAAVVLLLTGTWLTGVRFSFLGNEALIEYATRNDGSFRGLQSSLSWAEQKAETAARARTAAREQLPAPQSKSSIGSTRNAVAASPPAPLAAAEATAAPVGAGAARSSADRQQESVALRKAPAPAAARADAAESAEFVEESPEQTGAEPGGAPSPPAVDANRKLVRNAQVELEVIRFDDAVQKITAFAAEDRGYVATSSSEKQANGKLRGEVVVKVLPEKLDGFLLKLRGLGDLKNQTLGSEDVTKQYFDTDSRLKNARVMEQRLIDILKTKSSKVADLLEVEKELGRVRAQIEEMQGALKYMDAQVQFATVTITLAEKDMNVPAAFLLKRTAQLALFSNDVETTFAEAKAIVDGTKAQISSSTLDRDSSGEATARLVLLIVPEEADALIDRIKGMGRVQNYNEQTDRVAQGGTGMSENAKVERDKVQLSITISRNEQEPALQTTSLRIVTSTVTDKVARLKENAAKSGAEIRSSSFSRNPDGQEVADITLRVPMKNYAALLGSFDQLGKVKDVSVQREDRRGTVNEETAPADISIQVYSEGRIVGDETGLFATIRRTLAQGATALMWSLRMIGVALAFLAPWVIALAAVVWILRRISRRRAAHRVDEDPTE